MWVAVTLVSPCMHQWLDKFVSFLGINDAVSRPASKKLKYYFAECYRLNLTVAMQYLGDVCMETLMHLSIVASPTLLLIR